MYPNRLLHEPTVFTASSVYSDGTFLPEGFVSMERVFTTAYSAFIHSSCDFGTVLRTRGVERLSTM